MVQNKPLQTRALSQPSPHHMEIARWCGGMVFTARGGGRIGAKHHKVTSGAQTPGHAHTGARDVAAAPPTTSAGDAVSSGQVCWAYHPCQRDDANRFAPQSSAVVRANTQDRLMEGRGVYREAFEMVTRMNPEVAEVVRRHTVSARNQGRYERSLSLFGYNDDSDASDTEEEAAMAGAAGTPSFGREVRCEMRWAQNHARTTEFLMCLMLRWYNTHSHCFILYALSCLLLATGAGASGISGTCSSACASCTASKQSRSRCSRSATTPRSRSGRTRLPQPGFVSWITAPMRRSSCTSMRRRTASYLRR